MKVMTVVGSAHTKRAAKRQPKDPLTARPELKLKLLVTTKMSPLRSMLVKTLLWTGRKFITTAVRLSLEAMKISTEKGTPK